MRCKLFSGDWMTDKSFILRRILLKYKDLHAHKAQAPLQTEGYQTSVYSLTYTLSQQWKKNIPHSELYII